MTKNCLCSVIRHFHIFRAVCVYVHILCEHCHSKVALLVAHLFLKVLYFFLFFAWPSKAPKMEFVLEFSGKGPQKSLNFSIWNPVCRVGSCVNRLAASCRNWQWAVNVNVWWWTSERIRWVIVVYQTRKWIATELASPSSAVKMRLRIAVSRCALSGVNFREKCCEGPRKFLRSPRIFCLPKKSGRSEL